MKELAEATLWEVIDLEEREAKSLEYSELLEDLKFIGATQPLTTDQVKAYKIAVQMVKAAQERLLKEDPEPLAEVIDNLEKEIKAASEPSPEAALIQAQEAISKDLGVITFSTLSELYLAEQQDQLKPASLRDMRSACKTITAALTNEDGVELNLREHTREDMTNLKATLMPGRKPLTVNKLLTRLSTIFTWAVNSGYLEKTYNKGLKISKGAESGRKAFTTEQIQKVMDAMSAMPVNSWKRWAMSLGAITGARIGEVFQLTKADVRKVGDVTVIDINENNGKTLKNKHSVRLVPLVDGAYGFDLKAFLEFVDGCESDKLFDRVAHNFTRVLNETLRDILDLESGEGLTFHSLRHSLASLMKHQGIQVSIVQDILGHSSQTITFDLYGGDMRLAVGKLEQALKDSFGV
ncbi:TPA: site-specific integrase [Pseudomonas aeruginosa]|nr:site-specific integrase [Pseudomonas aeruginosa]